MMMMGGQTNNLRGTSIDCFAILRCNNLKSVIHCATGGLYFHLRCLKQQRAPMVGLYDSVLVPCHHLILFTFFLYDSAAVK